MCYSGRQSLSTIRVYFLIKILLLRDYFFSPRDKFFPIRVDCYSENGRNKNARAAHLFHVNLIFVVFSKFKWEDFIFVEMFC